MGKFGIGARVRDPDGDEGTIIDKRKGERSVRYNDLDIAPDPIWWAKWELTAVDSATSEPKFKAGDRVRLTNDNGGYGSKGDEGTLEFIDRHGTARVNFTSGSQAGNSYWVGVNDLVLVAANPAEPTLKLRAGGYYQLRNGEVVGPLVEHWNDPYVWTVTGSGSRLGYETSWTAGGAFHIFNDSVDSLDIVAEVDAPAPTLKIEAGKFYRTRDGRKRKVESEGDKEYPFAHYDENGDGYHAITAEGKSCINVDEDDIVAEWIDEPATLTIEVGKFYKTRDGRKAGPVGEIVGHDRLSAHVADDHGGVRLFRADGQHITKDCLDLVEEWVEPVVFITDADDGDIVRCEAWDGVWYGVGEEYVVGESVRRESLKVGKWSLVKTAEKPQPKFKVGDKVVSKPVPDAGIGTIIEVLGGGEYKVDYETTWFGVCNDTEDLIELAIHPVGTEVTITGTVSGLNGDNRSVVVGTSLAKQVSFDVPASALKAA